MGYVTKITTYNVPFEHNSADRFIKDVDTKLAKYKIADILEHDFSFEFKNTTSNTITILNSTRINYLKIDGCIFENKLHSYWFVTDIDEIASKEATRYKIELDVMATFGEDLFSFLNNKNIKINRLHQDRYVYDSSTEVFSVNTDNYGLINSDFNVNEAKGTQLIYRGGGQYFKNINKDDSNDDVYPDTGPVKDDPTIPSSRTQLCYNHIKNIDPDTGIKKTYYAYAVLNMLGDPVITTADFDYGSECVTQTVIAPINLGGEKDAPSFFQGINALYNFEMLQKDKIVSIFYSPYLIEPSRQHFVLILFDKNGKRIKNPSGDGGEIHLYANNTRWYANPSDFTGTPQELKAFTERGNFEINAEAMFTGGSLNGLCDVWIPKTIMSLNITLGKYDELEIGLLNEDISPVKLMFGEQKGTTIHMYNFLKDPANNIADLKNATLRMKGKFIIGAQSIHTSLSISNNQKMTYSENNLISFATNMGASYLAQNKYSIEAQRKGIDLNLAHEIINQKRNISSTYGGGLIGGALSLGNPANWTTSVFTSQMETVSRKIAQNDKMAIQATINDMAATAPTFSTGSDNTFESLNNSEFKWKFNWIGYRPNKIIRNKIIKYYDRFGYKCDDYINFTTDMINSRSIFNYFESDTILDNLAGGGDIDIDVLKKFAQECDKGIRIWHQEDIIYDKPNLEKIIVNNV